MSAAASTAGPRGGGAGNGLILVIGLLLLWQLVYLWVGESALSSPIATVRHTFALLGTQAFLEHVWETLRAFAIAFALSVALGLALGFWLGYQRVAGEILEPMVIAIYSVPKVTLYPILLLTFGLTLSAKVAFGVLHGVIPIILFTQSAVRNTRPILIKTGRALKLSQLDMIRWILFPAAVPEIFTGLRIGFSLTLIGSLLAEMFASQRGLGYLLMTGIGLHNVDQIMAVTLLVVVFAAAVSVLLLRVDRRLHRQS
jgi:NitT/TauT family transport system permease protein